MRKLAPWITAAAIAVVLFCVGYIAFGVNPFIGQWDAQIYGVPRVMLLSIGDTTITFPDGESRTYTYDDSIMTIQQPDGSKSVRLYNVKDADTILWIYFEAADGNMTPILVFLVRHKVPLASPQTWGS